MKVTIEIWQNKFNDEWNCDINTTNNGYDETESWAVDNFVDLLKLIDKKFPNAQCVKTEMCHCGRPLHYTDLKVKEMVDKLIKEKGEHVDVVCMNKSYRVPRHFIALHGLNTCDLDSLGFQV